MADFVDQLMDDRLALGDLATFSVDRDEDRLTQRIGEQRTQLLLLRLPGLPVRPFRNRVCNGGRPGPICGRPPSRKDVATATVWSNAIICPALWCGHMTAA